MSEILVIEDESGLRRALVDLLGLRGDQVVALGSIAQARSWLKERTPDVLISDVKLPDGDGLVMISELRASGFRAPAIVMTAFATVDRAVAALRLGASDFIVKPFDNKRLLVAVDEALAVGRRMEELELRAGRVLRHEGLELIGSDGGLHDIVTVLPRVGDSEATVLVRGESGTGKELIARAIHTSSPRRDGPFISLNCAALPATLLESELFGFERGAFTGAHAQRRGYFETASGGTLFLDEIGDMPLEAQSKLLRVLEQHEITRIGGRDAVRVDVRIVAATHRDLDEMAQAGSFRADLLYRLAVVVIELPPLRHRSSDIPGLARHFLDRAKAKYKGSTLTIGPTELERMTRYSWPGNVRELQNFIERSVVLGKLDVASLVMGPSTPLPREGSSAVLPATDGSTEVDADSRRVRPLKDVVDEAERTAVISALRATKGNKARAARLLGVSYKTLFNKIHEHAIREEVSID
ncbi:MAG: sigma-54-dependent Fis family transcriptional regulator [Deltaproteobacteria bacterium]|nr:sigma-54-dependent Fis family transcriptional regulator [Deltaproteobacteria bacterium]